MRILYFHQYFTTPAGAWSTRAYEFASRWVKAGDSVTVVTSVYDKSDIQPSRFVSTLNVDGITLVVLNIRLSNKHGFLRRLVTFSTYALIACWYALFAPADVVVSSSGPITAALPGLVAHYARRLPFVFEVRDLWPEGAIQLGIIRNKLAIHLARAFERICYRAAARIVCLSDGMAQWISVTYGMHHVAIVPNVSDNQAQADNASLVVLPSWAVGKKLVLYTGTLGLIDDCGQLLEMAVELEKERATDIELVIIGDGKERVLLEQKASALKLTSVHFLGLMPKRDVMLWLRAAYCALFVCKNVPFLSTASPNKLFDAFAVGVPVVQTTDGWIKELFDQQGCGITVAPDDPAELASAVLRLARDGILRDSLARNALKVGRELFDVDLLAARMRNVLTKAAGR